MVQGTEALQLVVAGLLAPIIIYSLRRMDMPSKGYIGAALIALTLSYAATVLEGFVAHGFFNTVEHGMLALSGVMFAMSAWVARKYLFSRERG